MRMWDITGRGICKDEPSCRSEPHQLHLVVAGGVSDFTPSFLCPSLLWSCAGVRCGAVDGVGPLHYKVTLRHRLRPFKQHQITISERLPPTNPAGRFRELAWRLGVK